MACGNDTALTAPLAAVWSAEGDGVCATEGASLSTLGDSIGVNIWFRFPNEDWKESGSLRPADASSQPMLGGFTWAIYESFPTAAPQEVKLKIELRHNTATVNDPLWETVDTTTWFDFDDYIRTSGNTDDDTRSYLYAVIRVAKLRREISVRYRTFLQLVSEISGSWTISLMLGFVASFVFEACANNTPWKYEGGGVIGTQDTISSLGDALVGEVVISKAEEPEANQGEGRATAQQLGRAGAAAAGLPGSAGP